MPRFVRNFWVSLSTDARSKPVESGPRSSGGGFEIRILVRENGSVSDRVVRISGECSQDGTLTVNANVEGSMFLETPIVLLTSKR